jgi:hypothetical protein
MKALAKSWQRFIAALVLFAGACAFSGFIGLGFRLLFFAFVVWVNEDEHANS